MNPGQLGDLVAMRSVAKDGTARRRRQAANVTGREFAQALGVSPSNLHRWETGECQPRAEVALRWWALLNQLPELEPAEVAS